MAAEHSPLDHVVQHPLVTRPADWGFLTPNKEITLLSDQIVMMIVAGLLLTLLVPMLVRRRRSQDPIGAMVPSGFANFFEVVCQYLRKEVAEPVLGSHTDRFIKYVWSAFFFVLTVNVLGLLPLHPIGNLLHTHLGGTATGNIWVTATLAVLTMIMMVVNGLRFGGKAYIAHFCPGPIWLAPLLVPVEIIGLYWHFVDLVWMFIFPLVYLMPYRPSRNWTRTCRTNPSPSMMCPRYISPVCSARSSYRMVGSRCTNGSVERKRSRSS